MPTVTLVTGVYNAGPFLERAVQSALRQTEKDFEYIIADDGSTDGCTHFLDTLDDPRVRLLRLPKTGRSPALNSALAEAKGEFAAILDADDLCEPDRLERQLSLFRADPELTVVGSTCWFMDADEIPTDIYYVPSSHTCILWLSLFHDPFVHSSAMFRLDAMRVLGLSYEPGPAEDYEFLSRLAWQGKAANDERPLVRYRVHPEQTSQVLRERERRRAHGIHRENLARLGWRGPSPERARDWIWGLPVPPTREHRPLLEYYLTLLEALEAWRHIRAEELAFLRRKLLSDLEAAS